MHPTNTSKSSTPDLVAYLDEGHRLRSAALWNFATHLKPSIEAGDVRPAASPAPARGFAPVDTARYMEEGRAMRNAVMMELVASAWKAVFEAARKLFSARRNTAFS